MESQIQELNDRLEEEEDNNAQISQVKRKLETEVENLRTDIEDMETALKKVSRSFSDFMFKYRILISFLTAKFEFLGNNNELFLYSLIKKSKLKTMLFVH